MEQSPFECEFLGKQVMSKCRKKRTIVLLFEEKQYYYRCPHAKSAESEPVPCMHVCVCVCTFLFYDAGYAGTESHVLICLISLSFCIFNVRTCARTREESDWGLSLCQAQCGLYARHLFIICSAAF